MVVTDEHKNANLLFTYLIIVTVNHSVLHVQMLSKEKWLYEFYTFVNSKKWVWSCSSRTDYDKIVMWPDNFQRVYLFAEHQNIIFVFS